MPPDEIADGQESVQPDLMKALFNKPGKEIPLPVARPVGSKPATQPPLPTAQNQQALQPDESIEDTNEITVDDLVDPSSQEPVDDDDPEYDIPVDGETKKVKLSQLKASYSGEGAIEGRLQQVTEAKKQAQQQAVHLHDANVQTLARLEQLNQNLQRFAEPNIDWQWLRQNNPQQYLDALEQQRIAREQQAHVQAEAQQVQQRQEFLNSQAMDMYLQDQAEALAQKLPDLADPDKSKAFMGRINKAVKHFGYTAEDLKEIVDHRVFVVLDYASRYLDLVQKKANLKGNGAAPSATLRTANSSPPSQTSKKKEEAIINRARRTGDPEDVAETLLIPQRKSRG